MTNSYTKIYYGFMLFCVFLIIFAWILTYTKIKLDYQTIIKENSSKTSNLAVALAEHTNMSIKSVNQILLVIKSELLNPNITKDLNKYLQGRHFVQSQLINLISLIDANGYVYATNMTNFKPTNVKDREYFKYHKNNNDDKMLIGRPALGRVTGKWFIPMSLRLEDAEGNFSGVVLASVNPYYFANLYKKVQQVSGCTIKLVDYEGYILSGYTDSYPENLIDLMQKRAPHLSLREVEKHMQQGSYMSKSSVDGIVRLRSVRFVPDYPLLISVAISEKTMFSNYWKSTKRFKFYTFLLTIFFLGLIVILYFQMKKEALISQKLFENQEKYRVLFESEHDAVIVVRKSDYKIVEANKAFFKVYGYQKSDLPNLYFQNLLNGENEYSNQELKLNQSPLQQKHKRKDNSIISVEAVVSEFISESEEYLIVAIRDISERKALEEAIRESEERFRYAVDATNDGLWDWDLVENRVYFSPRYYTMLGYEPYELPPSFETWKSLLHPNDYEKNIKEVEDVIKNRLENFTLEYRLRKKDNNYVWINGRGKVVEWQANGEPKRLIGTHTDISERKQFEQMLEQRILALTKPLDDTSDIKLTDLFNIDELQRIQDEFANATGVASIITDTEGKPVTKPSNFCYLCEHLIRKSEIGRTNCYYSDAVLGKLKKDGPAMQKCLSAGLWDGGTCIYVGEKPIANWLIGQIIDPNDDIEYIENYADIIGVDRELFKRELSKVKRMPKEQFEKICNALYLIAKQLSVLALQNVQQARYIYDLKQAQEAVRQAEDRLHSFIENLDDMVYFQALDGALTLLNKANYEITGYSKEEFEADPQLWRKIILPEDVAYAEEFFAKYPQGIPNFEVEYRLKTKDGKLKWIQSKMVAVYDDNNKIIGYNCIDRDITERKLFEISLYESNQKLNALINSSPLGIMVLDLNKIVRLWNKSCETIFGYTSDEVLGKPIPTIPEDQVEQFNQIIEKVKSNQYLSGIEVIRRRKDGKRINIKSFVAPLHDMNKNIIGMMGLVQDITELKQIEQEQMQLREQMQHTQKLESLGILAGGIAHDFNNLLMAIMGNLELALEQISPKSEAYEFLKNVENASRRAAELTKQMLAYSGKGKFVVQQININQLIREMTNILNVSISKKAQLKMNLDDRIPSIFGDPAQIRQIVMNLIINASEAIGDKVGEIEINTGIHYVTQQEISAFWQYEKIAEGNYVYLEVVDNGCGMDENTLSKIFDPFFTTKFTGRGLGLAAVLGIVRSHKGFIQVESTLNVGSIFKVYLPIAPKSSLVETPEALLSNITWQGSGRLLLVDDDEAIRDLGKKMFEKLGFEVVTAENGQVAIEIVNKNSNFKCVILDLTMPVMGGVETFIELRKIKPDLKIIIASGYNEQEISDQLGSYELDGFIQKPYSINEIKLKFSKILS